MDPSFEHFDHTADMGLRIRAATLPALIEPAGRALYAAIGELVPGEPADPATFNLTGTDAAGILREFLAELLHLVESEGRIATAIDVTQFDEHALIASAQTANLNPDKTDFRREVKAITYHELNIRPIPGGVEATVIVDI